MLVITEKFNCVVTFFLDARTSTAREDQALALGSNQKNQGFSFNLDTIFLTKNHSIAFEVSHFSLF